MSAVRCLSQYIVGTACLSQSSINLVKGPTSIAAVKSISKSFGLNFSDGFNAFAMAVYKVKLVGQEADEHNFDAPDDTYLLDAAKEAGAGLPYTFKAGTYFTCAGKVVSAGVDRSNGSFLDENQMKGYLLTSVSEPTSDFVTQNTEGVLLRPLLLSLQP